MGLVTPLHDPLTTLISINLHTSYTTVTGNETPANRINRFDRERFVNYFSHELFFTVETIMAECEIIAKNNARARFWSRASSV